MALKLGIMGGTFDPIHNGHIAIARSVAEQLALDRVLFIPAGNPHFKQDQAVTDASVRAHMVELAIAGEERFGIDRCEIDRPGITYTADTLEELMGRFPDDELFFIMGADSAATLAQWRRAQRVVELCTVVTVQRPGRSFHEVKEAFEGSPFRINALYVDVPQMDVSSTQIREMVHDRQSIDALVPEPVAAFIEENGLYRE